MKTQASALWILVLLLQVLSISKCEPDNAIPLDTNNGGIELDNSLPTDGSSSAVYTHVLERLEELEGENQRLRHDLEQSTLRLTAMVNSVQEENVEIRQQMADNAAQVTTLVTDVSKTVMEDLQQQSEMVQAQLSDIFSFLQEVKSQQASLGEQAEIVHNVLNVVQEFEDQSFNFTNRLEGLDTRLASVESTVLQFQVVGCGCSDELAGLTRPKEGVSTPTSPTDTRPTPTLSSTYSTYDWRGWSTEPTPKINYVVPTSYFEDKEVLVNSILVTKEGKIILADRIGRWLLMSSLEDPGNFLYTRQLGHAPWALLELPDGTVAITLEFSHDIAICRVVGDSLEFVRAIHTGADYGGIALGPEEGTLVVSKWQLDNVARLDIINMQGEVVRTLLDDSSLLMDPYCLRRYGDDLYVSDWTSDLIFRVNIHTGEVNTTLGSLDLKTLGLEAPRTFDIDHQGTIYLATEWHRCSYGSFCIVRITQEGEVKAMDELGAQYNGNYPYAVEISGDQIILSWTLWDYQWETELTFYSLPASSGYTVPSPAPLIMSSGTYPPSTPPTSASPLSTYSSFPGSLFTSILITREGKLLTSDFNRQTVKMISMEHLDVVEDAVDVGMTPWSLAEMDNGTVVVTSEDEPDIAFLNVNESGLHMEGKVFTSRRYRGVAVCGDGSLVASTRQNDDDYSYRDARIDVITRDGDVIDTLLEGGNFTDLVKPLFLTCRGEELFVSDWGSHKVFVLDVTTRQVSSAFGDHDLAELNLYQPRVVAFDQQGNMYVATGGWVCVENSANYYYYNEDESFCIIQVSPGGGWKPLDRYASPDNGLWPYGIAISGDQIIISWGQWMYGTWYTELAAYDLPVEANVTSEVYNSTQPWAAGYNSSDDSLSWV